MNDNPEGNRTFTPSSYDRLFYNEMSDEFWIVLVNYFFILFIYFFYLIQYFIHIIYFFLGRHAVAHRRNNFDRGRNSYRNRRYRLNRLGSGSLCIVFSVCIFCVFFSGFLFFLSRSLCLLFVFFCLLF